MKVLVVGGGGREHALAWKLAQDQIVTELHAIPGNPGMAQVAQCHPGIPADSADLLLHFAAESDIDLTVIGPEAPLVAGVVDKFRAAGQRIVGPTAQQARLEGSKVFAKQFFSAHAIPTAGYQIVPSAAYSTSAIERLSYPAVIKTDGLASGKGVIVAQDRKDAEKAMETLDFPLVIEEFLTGEEISFIVLSDGRDIAALEPCQDHKRIFDGDGGPNTGGMGAYCDSRLLTSVQREKILERILLPTVRATGFTGFLYAGLMMTAGGAKLLEFNARLGDPETQSILHRIDVDLGHLLLAAAGSRLREVPIRWRPEPSVCVVMAAAGYPQAARTGDRITGIQSAQETGAEVFHAGTRLATPGLASSGLGSSSLYTSGGRVLGVTARGRNLPEAIGAAYAGVSRIHFAGAQFRTDIGRKGLSRWPNAPLQ